MPTLLNAESLPYFFGPHFDVRVALSTANSLPDHDEHCSTLARSIEEGVVHTGLQLIGYENVDTGLSAVTAMRKPGAPSMISFYAESHHRVFGGTTIMCVPLAFCSAFFQPHGEYVVYRHTYKRPKVSEEEYAKIMKTGTDDEKVKLFLFTRSRDGFETFPGMTYVGISRRPWQKRYAEHIGSALTKGSRARLHQAMRQMQGQKVVHVHDISSVGLTGAEAREYEAKLIATSSLYPLGLNMTR